MILKGLMKKSDLQFSFPPELIATTPLRPSRVLWNEPSQGPAEIELAQLFDKFQAGDLLVINDTKVLPTRMVTSTGEEILFVKSLGEKEWEVLFPARSFSIGHEFKLPGEVGAQLIQKGLPQKLRVSHELTPDYFYQHGRVNLPPYILSERGKERLRTEDHQWYQTAWAQCEGSVAAPTASLHFSIQDLETLKKRGVEVERITLHVGLGTFFPLREEDLTVHKMHAEWVSVDERVIHKAKQVRHSGRRVWALGTTVVRALESVAQGKINAQEGVYRGESRLFIYPPFQFQLVNGLLTNFHQPESTLLALVGAFFGMKEVKEAYAYAIERGFRLFSYGDLSVWTR